MHQCKWRYSTNRATHIASSMRPSRQCVWIDYGLWLEKWWCSTKWSGLSQPQIGNKWLRTCREGCLGRVCTWDQNLFFWGLHRWCLLSETPHLVVIWIIGIVKVATLAHKEEFSAHQLYWVSRRIYFGRTVGEKGKKWKKSKWTKSLTSWSLCPNTLANLLRLGKLVGQLVVAAELF